MFVCYSVAWFSIFDWAMANRTNNSPLTEILPFLGMMTLFVYLIYLGIYAVSFLVGFVLSTEFAHKRPAIVALLGLVGTSVCIYYMYR